MKLTRLLIIFLMSMKFVFGQELGITEVKVVEGFKSSIPEASRLNENAVFADTVQRDRSQDYNVLDAYLGSNYKIRPLKAAKVKADKIPKLYQSKISLGTGYRVGSKINFLYNSNRSKEMSYGAIFKHFNNNVKIDDKQAGKSHNNLHFYFKKIKTDKIYITNLDYNRLGVFTHGNNTTDYNRFSYTRFSSFYTAIEEDPDKLVRDVRFFVSDLNEMSENQIHLSSNLYQTINDLPFNFEINFNNYLNYYNKDSKYERMGEKILQISPSTSITEYDIDFDVSVELEYSFDDTPFGYSPQIIATKELVKDVLLIDGGLRHSDQRHTLKSLSDNNPYIHSYATNQSILASSNDSLLQELEITDIAELYVSMQNLLAKDEVFIGSIAFGEVTNFAHFIMVENIHYKRFKVHYIESVWQLHAIANYNRKINEIISIDASLDYFKWDQEIFHKPDLIMDVNMPINLRNKIKVTPSFCYEGGRISQIDVLPALVYINISAFYSYSQQLSAYVQFNNLNNFQKEIWRDYNDIGFNGVFGINYSF